MMAIVSLGQNITQRMQAEKALRINEERYRELFNNMTSGVALYTVKDDGETFLFEDLNQAAEQIEDTLQVEEKKTVIVLRDITEKKMLQADALRTGHLAALGELAAGVAHEINKTLKMTLDLVETQLFRDAIHLSVSMTPDIPKIKANDQEIQQVFLNLISNARYSLNKKYPDTNKNKKLEISTQIVEVSQTPYVRVVFFDHGLGIKKTILNLITDPFFSTKPPGEGTGLGLSISYGIVQKHGGRLLFDSSEGVYAKVMVDLPIQSNPPLKLHSLTLG